MSGYETWAFLGGCLTVTVVLPLLKSLARWITGNGSKKTSIYALHHGVLNLDLLPKSMWMNMGYWKVRYSQVIACLEDCDKKDRKAYVRLYSRMPKPPR